MNVRVRARQYRVSIHAPARGATRFQTAHRPAYCVSIHAPARGATCNRSAFRSTTASFNPRARAGRDSVGWWAESDGTVSIHAPARGATGIWLLKLQLSSCFNPRARAGRDVMRTPRATWYSGFNPRARAGRDPASRRAGEVPHCFNPRARAGRDLVELDDLLGNVLFQSTRPRGARRVHVSADDIVLRVSIHAPARGATGTH